MAILKHGAIQNSDYGEAQRYLFFEQDPEKRWPARDKHGKLIFRKGMVYSGMNCEPFTFNTECTELNRRFRKNQGRNDIKAHHYIISFAPEDVTDGLLSPRKAHALATEFAEYFFAGHQALLVTHIDGNNHSGNCHTHIVINSLRKLNVMWQPFMERPCDARAGYKHHLTPTLLKDMQQRLNELCEREHLRTADFSLPTERKVSDREYRAAMRGQAALDEINEKVIAMGLHPRRTKYKTIKNEIRNAIDASVSETSRESDFLFYMKERYNVEVKVSRGRWSYIHQDRAKPIRDRSIGRGYERENVLKRLKGFRDMPPVVPPEYAALPKIFLIHSELRLVTDLQTCVKAQQSWAYARRVMISNLQEMARTVNWIQEQGIGTREELEQRYHVADEQASALRNRCAELNTALRETNERIQLLGRYLSNKTIYGQFLKAEDKPTFRHDHAEQIIEYEEAVRKLKELYPESFPTMKALKSQKTALMKEHREAMTQLKASEKEWRALRIATSNVEAMLDQPARAHMRNMRRGEVLE